MKGGKGQATVPSQVEMNKINRVCWRECYRMGWKSVVSRLCPGSSMGRAIS